MSANSSLVVLALFCLAPLAAADVLYVSNRGDGTVRRISPDGNVTTFASGFGDPEGLAFDRSGNLFVSVTGGPYMNSINRVTPAGTVNTLVRNLNAPYGIAFDSRGVLFVAESGSNTISSIASDGAVIPFVGGLNEPTFLVAQPVPEPGVLCLLALGSIGLVIRRRSAIVPDRPLGAPARTAAGHGGKLPCKNARA